MYRRMSFQDWVPAPILAEHDVDVSFLTPALGVLNAPAANAVDRLHHRGRHISLRHHVENISVRTQGATEAMRCPLGQP